MAHRALQVTHVFTNRYKIQKSKVLSFQRKCVGVASFIILVNSLNRR